MNSIKRMMVVGIVAGVLASSTAAVAAERGVPAPARKGGGVNMAAKLKELTVTGMLMKRDIKVAGKARTSFLLITDAGAQVRLPVAKAGDKQAKSLPGTKLAEYLNQNVKVVAIGSEQKKGDKCLIRLKTLKTIEKLPPVAPDTAPAKVG
jgi:hypothetical protein